MFHRIFTCKDLLHIQAGHVPEATRLFDENLKLRSTGGKADERDLVTAKHDLADAYADAGRYDDALSLQLEAVRWLESHLG